MTTPQPFVIRTTQAPATSGDGQLYQNTETTFVFPVAPMEVNITRIPLAYSELQRPGRKPLLQKSGRQLMQVSATFVIASDEDKFFDSAQGKINDLRQIAQTDTSLTIAYPGVPPLLLWRITDLRITPTNRNRNNVVTVANADVTFTEEVLRPAVVPGIVYLKDIPMPRSSSSGGGGATTGNQRGASPNPTSPNNRDLDEAVAAIIRLNPGRGNAGGTTGSPTP